MARARTAPSTGWALVGASFAVTAGALALTVVVHGTGEVALRSGLRTTAPRRGRLLAHIRGLGMYVLWGIFVFTYAPLAALAPDTFHSRHSCWQPWPCVRSCSCAGADSRIPAP